MNVITGPSRTAWALRRAYEPFLGNGTGPCTSGTLDERRKWAVDWAVGTRHADVVVRSMRMMPHEIGEPVSCRVSPSDVVPTGPCPRFEHELTDSEMAMILATDPF